MVADGKSIPSPAKRRRHPPESAAEPGMANAAGEPAARRPTGWKFIAVWIAFAATFLLTLVLGVQIVLGTKGLG